MARTGRPREFDRDEALERAMHLFWQHGFEATSLDQLKRAMGGISPASFYAAFGSKEALFREAVARYLATHGQVTAPLRDETLSPRDAIERTLRQSARMQTEPGHPSGCMVALSANTCSPDNAHLQALLRAERQANRDAMVACVGRAVASGELRPDTDAGALTALFDGLLVGLSIQARDGVPLDAMEKGLEKAMTVWDACRRDCAPSGQRSTLARDFVE